MNISPFSNGFPQMGEPPLFLRVFSQRFLPFSVPSKTRLPSFAAYRFARVHHNRSAPRYKGCPDGVSLRLSLVSFHSPVIGRCTQTHTIGDELRKANFIFTGKEIKHLENTAQKKERSPPKKLGILKSKFLKSRKAKT